MKRRLRHSLAAIAILIVLFIACAYPGADPSRVRFPREIPYHRITTASAPTHATQTQPGPTVDP